MEENNQEKKMYPVVCAECKKDTEVPFEPTGDRPVYCLDCNNARKEQGSGSYQEKKMYPATCAECNQETEVPFEPSGDRPVYCLNCFKQKKAQER
tara:strand:+ start:967 stop:1251 length:285 start_codon:yes stop_codon:yes gene_type:complete